jgi:curved DNA-binding protein CbpA
LLLDISAKSLNGLLRLSSGTTIKAIFFEEGRPVYAISNLPNEQFEHKLIKDRLAPRGLIEAGKKRNENAQCLGRTLVEIGVLKEKAMQDAARALATEIIESLFELTQGEYGFEEGVTAAHDAVLESSAAESILERARTASLEQARTASKNTAVTPPLDVEEVTKPVDQEVPAKPKTVQQVSGNAGLRPPSGAGVREEVAGSAGFQPAPGPAREEATPGSATLRAPSGAGVREEAPGTAGFQPAPGPARKEATPGSATLRQPSGAGVREEVPGRAGFQPAPAPVRKEATAGSASLRPPSGAGVREESPGSAGFQPAPPPPRKEGSPGSATLRAPSGGGAREEFPGRAGFPPAATPPRKEASPVSAGLRPPSRPEVRRPGAEPVATGTQAPVVITSGVSVDWLMQEVTRKLNSLEGADYYQVLGVTKLASTSTINAAYERLRGMFNSYRSSVPHHEELTAKLDALFNRIKQAHETLSDIQRRRVYDIPAGKQTSEQFVIERGLPEVTRSTPPWRDPLDGGGKELLDKELGGKSPPAKSPPAKSPSAEESRPQARAAAAGTGPAVFAPPAPEVKRLAGFEAERVADQNFQQGRTYFERRDLHAAVHMFREAVRLNDKRGDYHFQLGITLFILSQARGVHSHGEGCHVTCNLGGGLSRNQRIRREAEQHLLKAAEMDPYNAEIRVRLGMLYKDAGMAKKAQQAFHEALLLDASNVVALSEFDINAEDYPEDETPKHAKPTGKKKPIK